MNGRVEELARSLPDQLRKGLDELAKHGPKLMSVNWNVLIGYELESLGLVNRTFWADRSYLTPLGLAVREAIMQEEG